MKCKTITMILLLLPLGLFADIICNVIKISDGDTFTILTADGREYKIRLYGIDCPEKHQPFGEKATIYTSSLVCDRAVKIRKMGIDRYRRLVVIVLLPDGRILNEELLKAGLAWHYPRYDSNRNWSKLQDSAKANMVGLWASCEPSEPWQWRNNKRTRH